MSGCSQKVLVRTPEQFSSFRVHSHPPAINVKIYRDCLVEEKKILQECIGIKDGIKLMNTIVQQRFIIKTYEKDIKSYLKSIGVKSE
jgi:hypothetical protein